MIRVVIADDQSLIRAAIRELLAGVADIEIVAEATNGAEAVAAAVRHRPDVVVMDIRMPQLDGIQATTAICADRMLAATRVLILTTFEEDEYLLAALRAGASGFIGKGAEPDEIVHAIRAVHAGDALLSPAATQSLISRFLETDAPVQTRDTALLDQLTPRELEILLLVARGASNDEIATELYISPATAKTHVNRVMAKLGAHDRAQLVIWAYETKLISPGR